MKTRKLSLATFILGALCASLSACSAQSSGTPPRGDATGNTSSGGTGNAVSSGATGNVVSAGGSTVVVNGGATSVGGTVGAAGTTVIAGGGSPVTGGGGTTATPGSCVMAVGTATDLSIDDLEDGDNAIQAIGQRTGYWYTYNDGTGTQTPKPDPSGVVPFKPTMGGHSPLFSAETSGTAFTTWGAGMGFDFNNTAMKSCVYNASAYTGIKFWAKGNVPIKAMVKIPATTQSTSDSGTCTTAMMCEDHYTLTPAPILAAAWTQYTITFADTTTFAQAGWGVKVPFDKANIIAMQFQVNMGAAFDVSIDDVTFY
ncbi:MAG TPA: hypothetical protein VNW92_21575 [Polyangiaceae bacterium]|nr:hypothetical protein [Polyangiaceae bacterium]